MSHSYHKYEPLRKNDLWELGIWLLNTDLVIFSSTSICIFAEKAHQFYNWIKMSLSDFYVPPKNIENLLKNFLIILWFCLSFIMKFERWKTFPFLGIMNIADALKIERKNKVFSSSINFQFNKSIHEEVIEELIEFWNSYFFFLSHFSINRITYTWAVPLFLFFLFILLLCILGAFWFLLYFL